MVMNMACNLVIPFTYDPVKMKTNVGERDRLFSGIMLKHSLQLKGSLLLDEKDSPLEGCFALRQTQRRKTGLYGNENYTCLLIKEQIEFQIGKVRLWLFKNGIGFITIDICADEISDSSVLDLISGLCAQYPQKKISYQQPVGRGIRREVIVTINGIVDAIFGLSDKLTWKHYESTVYKSPGCVFYGYGDSENREQLSYFLEMLRMKYKSARRAAHGIQAGNVYKPFAYILWAVSENVLAAFGDTGSCGTENRSFLTDNGGLKQSIFANYLPVYLHCLSSYLKLDQICRQNNIHNAAAVRLAPKEAIEQLRGLLNTPVEDMTQESHINELFREYVCRNAWHLQAKREMFDTGEISGFMEEIHHELTEVRINTGRAVNSLVRIEQQMLQIVQFIETDMREWLAAKKKQFCSMSGQEDMLTAQFIEESAAYINDRVMEETDLVSRKKSDLQKIFGRVWERLLDDTRISLISAGVLWEGCSEITWTDFDFSGVCISATSALEMELKRVFFVGFQEYIAKTYGKPDGREWEKTFDTWPERFLSWNRRNYQHKADNGEYPKINRSEIFTMGMMPYLFGRYDKKIANGQDELIRRRMEEYLKTILSEDYIQDPIGSLYQPGNAACFVENCEKVRNDYRNPAAHANILTRESARMCYLTIIGTKHETNYASPAVGLIQRLYSYLK